jgi:hypothetical protein
MQAARVVYDRFRECYVTKGVDTEGITNHNYPEDSRKLKLFVMKGAKK